MSVFRSPRNPIIVPKDVIPSRSDFEIVGVFNAGVADTGVQQNHPAFAGISFFNNSGSPTDPAGDGHGTHVAGIAAAVTDNAKGVAGVGYNCSLMNIKVLRDDGRGSYSWIADGIEYAADHGAHVINMSLGGTDGSSTLQAAVDYAWGKGVVVVAAAGNKYLQLGSSLPRLLRKLHCCGSDE